MHPSQLSLRAPLIPARRGADESGLAGRSHPSDVTSTFLFRMIVACHILQLQTETRFTALVLLHRYVRAVEEHAPGPAERRQQEGVEGDLPWVGAACIFLACKAEEEPRRLRDVINMVHMVLSRPPTPPSSVDGNGIAAQTGRRRSDGNIICIMPQPPNLNEDYWKAKKRVIETEQAVLRWLGFDVFVSHPHRAVFLMLEVMPNNRDKVMAIAFRRLNDALFSSQALEHPVVELACAAIELAVAEVDRNGKVNGNGYGDRETTTSRGFKEQWWAQYRLTSESLKLCMDHLVEATSYVEMSTETN